ncbi:hypothetical protein Tco_0720393 [Tanacetum coccineum]
MAQPQQILLADQLVSTKYQSIRRCNNYTVPQNIPFLKECKIVGQILVDHALSYALTATADVPVKFDSIPKRLEEDYHSIKDDVSLVSVYTTGNVIVKGMLISDEFLIDDIRETQEYKDYAKKTPGATRTPNPEDVVQNKRKSKQVAGEPSTPRKSHKVTIKQKKSSTTPNPPPSDDMAAIDEKILDEDVDKIVEGEDEESYASEFVDSVFLDEEDTDDKKDDDNDDDNDDHDDHALVRNKKTGSLEDRTKKMQTPIPSPPRSPRTDLSLDKIISQELTATVSPALGTTSQDHLKPTSSKTKVLPGSIAQMSRQHGQLWKHMKQTFVTNSYFQEKMKEMSDTLYNLLPELTVAKTNELIKEAVPRMVNDAVKKDREISTTNVHELISREFDVHALKIIEELFKIHMKETVLNVHPTTSTSTATTTTTDIQHQLYLKMKSNLQDQVDDLELWDVLKRKSSEERKYVFSFHKIHAVPFFEEDLEEKMNRWVRKEFKTFNEEARLSIQHWKDSWHKTMYKINHKRVRANPEEYFSNHRIVEVVKVTTEQQHGLDYMEQIIVMRENDKPDSFLRSRVIWEKVHDFQLGIESYQIKINLTAPTLIFPSIEACDPYSIVDKPTTGLIYLNNKNEKRVIDLIDISKFCDATLERVLNEVKLKNFETELLKKAPLLGGKGGSISMTLGTGGGWFTKCLMELTVGSGGGGLAVLGGRSSSESKNEWGDVGARCREVKGGGVVLGVVKSALGKTPGGAIGVVGGESRGVEGGVV